MQNYFMNIISRVQEIIYFLQNFLQKLIAETMLQIGSLLGNITDKLDKIGTFLYENLVFDENGLRKLLDGFKKAQQDIPAEINLLLK
jgi:hypothetical protein